MADIGRRVNERLGTDLTDAAWRGLWNRNPEAAGQIRSALASRVSSSAGASASKNVNGKRKVAIISDIHVPYHDPFAIEAALNAIQVFGPDYVIINGDMLDFYALSSFDRDPERINTLQLELDTAVEEVIEPLQKAVGPGVDIDMTEGNHEARLKKYLWRHPEIASLRIMSVPNLMGLPEMGIDYVTGGIKVNGDVVVTHGTTVRKWAGNSVRGEMEKRRFGWSMVMGHIHRQGKFMTWSRQGNIWGIETGCLCTLQPEYMDAPDWSQGITLLEYDGERMVGHPVDITPRSYRVFIPVSTAVAAA